MKKTENIKKEPVNRNELVYLVHLKDEEAFSLLFDEFSVDIRYIYRTYLDPRFPFEEWQCEACEMLEKTICRFREDQQAAFKTFYIQNLKKRAIDLYRACRRKNKPSPGFALSIDAVMDEMSGRTYQMPATFCVEESVLTGVMYDQVISQIRPKLSDQENHILELLYAGHTKKNVSRILQIDYYRVDAALHHARQIWYSYQNQIIPGGSDCYTQLLYSQALPSSSTSSS